MIFEGDVEKFTAPGAIGPFQVLYNHAPIVAALTSGLFSLTSTDGKTETYHVSGGVLELHQNKATVLADAVETPSEIDVDRARRALERAQERLRHRYNVDVDRAEAALGRATARLRIAGATIEMH